MFKEMIVTVKNTSGESFDLAYDIRDTESAQLWASSLEKAIPFGLYSGRKIERSSLYKKRDQRFCGISGPL